MATTEISTKLIYPVSKMPGPNWNEYVDYIEFVDNIYGNNYVNKFIQIHAFSTHIISSYPIFNRLDELFNTELDNPRYAGALYFGDDTYFRENPRSNSTIDFGSLTSSQTVKFSQLSDIIHANGLELYPVATNFKCKQVVGGGTWKESNIIYNENVSTPMLEPANKCEIKNEIFDGLFYASGILSFEEKKSCFATIVGKVKVPKSLLESNKTTPYYTPEYNLWAGLLYLNNLIAVTELHVYKNDIAYFSFQVPLVNVVNDAATESSQRLRVVVPFRPAKDESLVYRFCSTFEHGTSHYLTLSSTDPEMNTEWILEGPQMYAFKEKEKDSVPVYLLYKENIGYYYTISESDKSNKLSSGWIDKDIAFYAYQNAGNGRSPIYQFTRQDTMNREDVPKAHTHYLFTTNKYDIGKNVEPAYQNLWTNAETAPIVFYVPQHVNLTENKFDLFKNIPVNYVGMFYYCP